MSAQLTDHAHEHGFAAACVNSETCGEPPDRFLAQAGCRFDFSAETIKPLVELVRSELGKLA